MRVYRVAFPLVGESIAKQRVKDDRRVRRGGVRKRVRALPTVDASDCEHLNEELHRLEEALRVMRAAHKSLKAGDDAALYALGFSESRVAELRSQSDGGRAGYPSSALRKLRWHINLFRELLAQAQAAPTR